jgi:hypothetical protein
MIAVTAVLAGGAAFKEAVASSINLTVGSQKLAQQLGISASKASVLKMALGDVYVTEEQLSSAAGKITQGLNRNEEAFSKLGVATRDSNGNFRSTLDIMSDTNARLLEFKEGTDRNIEGVKIYGKAWAEVAPTLRLTAEAQEEAQKKAEALGMVVGEENTAAVAAYRAAMNDAIDVTDALQKSIGDALLPALTRLNESFASTGSESVGVLRGALVGLVGVFEGLWAVVKMVGATIAAALSAGGRVVQLAFELTTDLRNLDFSGMRDSYNTALRDMKHSTFYFGNIVSSAGVNMVKNIKASYDSAFGKQTETKPGAAGGTSEGGAGSSGPAAAARSAATAAAKAAKDRFDAEIENLKGQEAAARNNYEIKIALAEQEAQRIGAFYGLESKAYAAAQNHIVELKRAAAEQLRQIEDIRAQTVVKAALAEVDARESAARLEVELNQATKAELLAQQQEFENQRFAIRQQALIQELQLAAQGNDDPVKVMQVHARIQELTLAHEQRLREIRGQAMVEQTKTWRHMFDGMQTGMTGAIKGMLAGTQGFTKSVRGLFAQLGGAFDNMVANLVVNWGKAMFQKVVMGKGAAMKTIMIHAKEAAAAAFSSVAAIPFVGPFLAPAAAAAAFAATASFANFSAEGGFNIPAGVNPVTQLHQEEMVLPAELANAVREMAGVGGGVGGGSAPIHLHVSAIDARSIEQWASIPANAAALSRGVRSHVRRRFGDTGLAPA